MSAVDGPGDGVGNALPADVTGARPIGWSEMRRLLEQVAERLDPDVPVDMWIAGWSALASADLRLSTTDVDVVSDVPDEVYASDHGAR